MLGQARRSRLPIIRLPMYVNDPVYIPKVRSLLEATEGVAQVLGEAEKPAYHLDHPRSGELVAIAQSDAWFPTYWLDDNRAPILPGQLISIASLVTTLSSCSLRFHSPRLMLA